MNFCDKYWYYCRPHNYWWEYLADGILVGAIGFTVYVIVRGVYE